MAAIDRLADEWSRCLGGDTTAQSRWENIDAGDWNWQNHGLCLKRGEREWYSLAWNICDGEVFCAPGSFLIEITIQGEGEAAGLSFGPFRDFLAQPSGQGARLQMEVDCGARRWLLRVDGRVVADTWWNSAVRSIDDIVNGALTLKARRPRQVVFQDLRFHVFQESCKLSVIMTCNRFLQRLRVSLRNWCCQSVPRGAHEILVVNPDSSDGTHEYLRVVARSYPEVRVREVAVPAHLGMNKGAMINCALPLACGEWIWFTDADCVFPPHAAAAVLDYAPGRANRMLYGRRRYLTAGITSDVLCGRRDSIAEFDRLVQEPTTQADENAPWGYTQIVHRSAVERWRYPESFNHFAHGDGHFIDQCRARGVTPEQMPQMVCLHLDHPFAWYGTNECL
jgi:hypothetical protein